MSRELLCPVCGYPQYCDCCDYCKSQIPEGFKAQIRPKDLDGYQCPNCGFKAHADTWSTIEYEQHKKEE